MNVSSEIQNMLTSMTVEEEPKEKEETPKEEEKKDLPKEEELVAKDEEMKEEEEEEEEEEEDATKSEFAELKAEIAELKAALKAGRQEKEDAPVEEKEEPLGAKDFVTDDEYAAVLEDKAALNALLNKVYKDAVEYSTEAVLKRMPRLITQQVSHETANQQMVQEFFLANKDLLPVRRYVAMEFQQVLSSDPSLSYPDALAETAKAVRKTLGLTAQQRQQKNKKPSLPDGTRSRQAPRKPGGLADEIAAMARAR